MWSVDSPSPALVSFSNAELQSTHATFSEEGVYTIRVRAATAAGGSATSSLVVEVYDTNKGHSFGYNTTVLRQFFVGDAGLKFDTAALSTMRNVSAPPPVGVHPRVLFSPEDLPDIRTRLKNTAVGQTLWTAIHDRVVRQLTGGTDSKGKVFADQNRTSKTGTGPDPEGGLYDSLVAGNVEAVNNATPALQSNTVGLIAYAGLVLQVDPSSLPDGTADKVCAALATAGAAANKNIAAALPASGCSRWQHTLCDYREQVQGLIYREFTGLAYDMLAPMMTGPQRDSVRRALALATREMWSIGMDSLRSPSTGTSNWVPTHMMHLMVNTLAIEGEEGYSADLLPRLEAGYERFLTNGLLPDGAAFEGMGKNSIWAQMLLMLRRRGSLLPALTNVRAHVQDFYLAATAAHGWTSSDGSFTWDEMDGGIQCESKYADVATLKFLYPDDPRVDFVYQTGMANLTRLVDFNLRFPYKGMEFFVRAVTASDWSMAGQRSWPEAQASLEQKANRTYFFDTRGLFVARSDWSTDALQLFFQPRSVQGGHTQFDRTKIALAAHGRWWIPYRPIDKPATIASVMYVNGGGPSTIPAAVRAVYESSNTVGVFGSEAIASFAVSDATLTYSYRYVSAIEHHENKDLMLQPAPFVANDFLLRPRDDAQSSALPYAIYPDWQTSEMARANITVKNDTIELSKAFRTVGIVRGSEGSGISSKCSNATYALVIDDIALATPRESTEYTWRAMLATDLSGANASFLGADCILTDTLSPEALNINRASSASGARLLLRQLRPASDMKWSLTTVFASHDGKSYPVDSVDAKMTASIGNFVTLLFPLRPGEDLPKTSWSDDGTMLSIKTASGCRDALKFAKIDGEPFERVEVNRVER